MKRKILLNPGPATTSQSVKMAQVVPDICPREVEFTKLIKSIRLDLLKIIKVSEKKYSTVLFGGSGTSAMDSIISSVIDGGNKLLILINGAYGERMKQIAETYSINYETFEYNWGEPINFIEVEKYLVKNNDIKYIAMVHHETTTGILNPIKKFTILGKKYNCTLMLDAISSYGGIPIDLNVDPVDYILSTSNKCIQGMAGIAFVICKKESLNKIKNIKKRSYYLDLFDQYSYLEKNGQMRFTPPVQTFYALRKAIDEHFEEGEASKFKRYEKNWRILRSGLISLGFKLLIDLENESKILLTIIEPTNIQYNFNQLHDIIYKEGFTIYPGKLKNNNNTFRLSVMGDIDSKDINNFLSCMKTTLIKMGIKKIKY